MAGGLRWLWLTHCMLLDTLCDKSRRDWRLPLVPRGSSVTPLCSAEAEWCICHRHSERRGCLFPAVCHQAFPAALLVLRGSLNAPSPPFSPLCQRLGAWCSQWAPHQRPVPVCLPRVLLWGHTRRAGAVIPVMGCSAASLRALNSGCISPLRQLHFSGEE